MNIPARTRRRGIRRKENRTELRCATAGAGLFYQFRKQKRGEIVPRLIRLVTRHRASDLASPNSFLVFWPSRCLWPKYVGSTMEFVEQNAPQLSRVGCCQPSGSAVVLGGWPYVTVTVGNTSSLGSYNARLIGGVSVFYTLTFHDEQSLG